MSGKRWLAGLDVVFWLGGARQGREDTHPVPFPLLVDLADEVVYAPISSIPRHWQVCRALVTSAPRRTIPAGN